MFKDLADLGMVRSTSQAFGFYLAYLLLFLALGALVGLAVALAWGIEDAAATTSRVQGIASVLAGLTSSYITYLVLVAKGMMRNFSGLVFVVAAAALGMLGGGFLGLVLPAYLSTKNRAN